MKTTNSLLILFFLISIPAIGQDTIATVNGLTEIYSVFMNLPVREDYSTIMASATKNENFRTTKKETSTKSVLENTNSTKLRFEQYVLHPEDKCTDCYILCESNHSERILSLVLNFETFNQERYNELVKKILAKVTPHVKLIEQNIGDHGAWETLLLLDKKKYTPRIRIKEPSKEFTRIRIDYISAL